MFLSLMKCLCKSGKTQKPLSWCGTGKQPSPGNLWAYLCPRGPVVEVEGVFLKCVFFNLIFITDSKFSSPWLAVKFINYSSDEDDPGGGDLSRVI